MIKKLNTIRMAKRMNQRKAKELKKKLSWERCQNDLKRSSELGLGIDKGLRDKHREEWLEILIRGLETKVHANRWTDLKRRWQRPGVDDEVQTWTGRREYLENGRVTTSKTKRSRVGSVGRRSQETDQSKHEVNGSRTEEGVGQKLPKDSRLTGFL